MSVQVRRRRESAAFLSTFVGAQGELLVDTTNNRVQVHDGATPGGWPAARLADVIGRTPVADAAYAALAADRTIAFTTLTAARTVTLPAAAAYPTGTILTIVDESGACSTSNAITVSRAGTDTINGAASYAIGTAYGYVALECNGSSKWTIVDAPAGAGTLVAIANGGTGTTSAGAALVALGAVGRTAIADASYTALAADRTIALTSLSAARTITLPAASAYPTGTQLLVLDESGACSFTNTITIARAGSDTIDGATSAVINTPYGFLALTSNSIGKWAIVDFVGATTAQLTNRNVVINGNFAINQRAYVSGTALAAGAYAHDRFKAGASGATYTFSQTVPDTQITITAGSLIQAVEAANVAATGWWLTWTGTANARVWQGSASGSYSAGIAMTIGGIAVNALLVTGLTAGTIANVEFGTGTLGLVQLEAALPNVGPTRFERRLLGLELALCRGYFRFAEPGIGTWFAGGASSQAQLLFNYADMRPGVTPALSLLTSAVTIADPGVANVGYSNASVAFNSIGPASATVNFSAGGGSQTGSATQYHVALLVTAGCVAISKEL